MSEMAALGLQVLPLSKARRAAGYQSASAALGPNDPWDYRCAITTPGRAVEWVKAWDASDDARIGELLGYPACCRQFFQEAWVRDRWMDTTWPMAQNSPARTGVNMLFRWFGVRPVSHLPCAFDCAGSLKRQEATFGALPAEEAAWLRDVLSWPVLWSSLHGVAEITTPIFRASVPTDPLASVSEVRYEGTGYPAEGARGVSFPYRTDRGATPSDVSHVRNGFASNVAMTDAHAALLRALPAESFGTVVDFGCGDGALLAQIPATRRVGVEREPDRVRAARARGIEAIVGDVTDPAVRAKALAHGADLVIAQRERNPAAQFSGVHVLSYSYEPGAAEPQVERR
jgi:hypothetical protein